MEMNKIIATTILGLFLLSLITVTSATTTLNCNATVSNGYLSCDSKSQYSSSGGPIDLAASNQMTLKAVGSYSDLTHNLILDNSSIHTDLTLNTFDSKATFFDESASVSLIKTSSDDPACYSGSSSASALSNQIDLASTSDSDYAESLSYSIDATGNGNFKFSSATYNIYSTSNESYNTDSSSSSLAIYNSDRFDVHGYFEDPIENDLNSLFKNSDKIRRLCPFFYNP